MDYPGKVITKTQVTPTQTSASGNWTLDDQAAAIKNNNWPVALVPNPISKSLRFNSADSAYLNKTFATNGTGGGITVTFSAWVKRGTLGSLQSIIGADSTAGTSTYFGFNSSNNLEFTVSATTYRVTSGVFRDPSAWYHVVLVWDSSNATDALRCRIYVNGTLQTYSTSPSITLNTVQPLGFARAQGLGADTPTTGARNYFDGYLTEINFIDGQALTPSSFGMTNPQTGQWIPLKYSGTYGTNGFYLNFKDATSTTTLGYDYSGNANNWTTNNFSVTAGAGNDSLTDVPTPWTAYNTNNAGGVVRGNYATLNPLLKDAAALSATLTNGNLDAAAGATGTLAYSTIGISSGKWYLESVITALPSSGTTFFGICESPYNSTYLRAYRHDTGEYFNGSAWTTYGAAFTTNDVIGMALDLDNQTIEFFKNGTSQGQKTSIGLSGRTLFSMVYMNTTPAAVVYNFGQRPFAYTPPTGFRSLCTTNLPATAIGFGLTNQANKYFDVTLYTGNGSTQTITNSGSMQPDFVWAKNRTITGSNHRLFDSVRGSSKILYSSLTNAEATDANGLTSFNSNGFSIGSTQINDSGSNFVGWQWRASNATAVTNTAGTITSTVSANTTAGFSIVTYTGTGSNATVGHGLGVAPDMIIVKNRTNAGQFWAVGHSSLTSWANGVYLNSNAAQASATTLFNSTAPTSTVFSVGTSGDTNGSTHNMVAYCFDAVPGYSAFGSYTGNGSADGPFVYTGFRPRWVMVKQATVSSRDWIILDTSRNTYNVADLQLLPNTSEAESTTFFSSTAYLDILSNGFKVRNTSVRNNENTATYIYAAFAESPFQFSNAR